MTTPRPAVTLVLLASLALVACPTGKGDTADPPGDVDGDGYTTAMGDCNDQDTTINPSAVELWYDGVDQDCTGNDDFDADFDGYQNTVDCWDDPLVVPDGFRVVEGTDALGRTLRWTQPTAAMVHPDGMETAYDGVDQDCDGADEFDQDGDGYLTDDYPHPVGDGTVAFGDDCIDDPNINIGMDTGNVAGDAAADVHPGATEVWYDGTDQDCDANDCDQDGDGRSARITAYCASEDCDDTDPTVYLNPAIPEVWYNGFDENCDGNDGDQDHDGFWAADYDTLVRAAGATPLTIPAGAEGDCWDDPAEARESLNGLPALAAYDVKPGAEETPYDGIDQDCNGGNDFDQDGDGYDDLFHARADGTTGDDCMDVGVTGAGIEAAAIHPGATETWYNGTDEDCDRNDGDQDGDTYVIKPYPFALPPGYQPGDCDDLQPLANPGATETWYDGVDNDCDSNDGDIDLDGYFVEGYAYTLPTGALEGDCLDTDATVNPGMSESCATAADDDCSGTTNDAGAWGCTTFYADYDGDGWGSYAGACLCAALTPYTSTSYSDCEDSLVTVYPGAPELCDRLDNDCDGYTDDSPVGATTWYPDLDRDGWGASLGGVTSCSAPTGYVTSYTDCNDASAAVSPAATETCNGVDDDCDGVADDDACSPEDCDNGLDDNGNGLLDCEDAECVTDVACTESRCTDGSDDEGDGLTDCDDPDCWGAGCTPTVRSVVSSGNLQIHQEVDSTSVRAIGSGTEVQLRQVAATSAFIEGLAGTVKVFGADSPSPAWSDPALATCTWRQSWEQVNQTRTLDARWTSWGGDGIHTSSAAWSSAWDPFFTGATAVWQTFLENGGNEPTVQAEAIEHGGLVFDEDCPLQASDTWFLPDAVVLDTRAPYGVVLEGFTPSAAWGTPGAAWLSGEAIFRDTERTSFTVRPGSVLRSATSSVVVDLREGQVAGEPGFRAGGPLAAPRTVTGAATGDRLGFDVAWLGDLDGDGLDEALLGAPGDDTATMDGGVAYLVGGDDLLGAGAEYDVGSASLALTGGVAGDRLGRVVVAAGDLDADGVPDAALGVPGTSTGAILMLPGDLLGTSTGSRPATDVAVVLESGTPGDGAGWTLAAIGDVDEDGVDDLLAGAWGDATGGEGAGGAWILYGPLASGSTFAGHGTLLTGTPGAQAGRYVSGGQDADGDGVADLAVASTDGQVWVVSGNGFLSRLTSLDLSSGADAIVTGAGAGDLSFGRDLNGDGHGDLLAGGQHVLYGPVSSGEAPALADASFTWSLASDLDLEAAIVPDLDGDALADVVFGAWWAASPARQAGRIQVLYGPVGGTIDLPTAEADLAVEGPAAGALLGQSFDAAGDLDGDGTADLLTGAPGSGGAGEVFVLLGRYF